LAKVSEQNMTLRNRDKGAERRFGLSTCYTGAAEFYCRISIGVGALAVTTPHAGMPMFMLTANQRAEIIAYILSLR
jgi:hypothetical protein